MMLDMDSKTVNEDEVYDEEADSDFDASQADQNDGTSSESEADTGYGGASKTKKGQRGVQTQESHAMDLDSGDEATIKEQEKKKKRRKRRQNGGDVNAISDDEDVQGEWRARTRAMREREQDTKRQQRLATSKDSTIDVDKLWEEMNRPGPVPPPVRPEGGDTPAQVNPAMVRSPGRLGVDSSLNREKVSPASEEMVTIKRKFKFAGEIHTEEKVVPKSSAEAQLWLAQKAAKADAVPENKSTIQRPLRKISRFDPNYHNLTAFKASWAAGTPQDPSFKGPKLNVVEKSKIDWASHVDAEGLKDELDVHARAKEGYHGRMDFLDQVQQRKDEEARQARLR